jgi:8-amino-7-oxononanoate synthase
MNAASIAGVEQELPAQQARRPNVISRADASLTRAHAQIAHLSGQFPFGFVLEHPSTGSGGEIINFGSNNYLGLSTHPEVVAAAQEATRAFGTSTTGPRLFNGTLKLHLQLEEELADFYGKQAAAILQSGFAANVALLSSLLTPKDKVIFDRDSHASQREGAERSRIPSITFRHNDPASLGRRIAAIEPSTAFLVAVDGVFSMDGSVAPVREIAGLTKRNGGTLLVDEAHGIGVLGETGRGAAERHGCLDDVDLVTVSLSKALAGTGGAVIGPRAVVEEISYTSRAYIFTASCDPAAVAAALASLRLLRENPGLPALARRNGQLLRAAIADAGWQVMPGETPLACVPVRNRISAIFAWRSLLESGIYANVAMPPAVPEAACVVRLVATANHSEHDFERLHSALEKAREGLRQSRKLRHGSTDDR